MVAGPLSLCGSVMAAEIGPDLAHRVAGSVSARSLWAPWPWVCGEGDGRPVRTYLRSEEAGDRNLRQVSGCSAVKVG